MLFLADRGDDFLSLCRVEHERAWIVKMFLSIGRHDVYSTLIDAYKIEGSILDEQRRRVRNALVHGNPTSFAVVQSVREYAEFAGGTALHLALESYVEGTPAAVALAERSDEFIAMDRGQDAATYWRELIAR